MPCGGAPRERMLPLAQRLGRARLSALHRGTRRGFTPGSARAALPGTTGCKRENPLRRQCSEHLAVRSRAGRADAQAARGAGLRSLSARTAPAPFQGSSLETPFTSELGVSNNIGDKCQDHVSVTGTKITPTVSYAGLTRVSMWHCRMHDTSAWTIGSSLVATATSSPHERGEMREGLRG